MHVDFLAKLFLVQQERPEVQRALIARQHQTCQAWLARLRQHAADATLSFDAMSRRCWAGWIVTRTGSPS
jgi:hypothetical protein